MRAVSVDEVNARAVTEQEMPLPAVALREAFSAVVAAQEVATRAEAVHCRGTARFGRAGGAYARHSLIGDVPGGHGNTESDRGRRPRKARSKHAPSRPL